MAEQVCVCLPDGDGFCVRENCGCACHEPSPEPEAARSEEEISEKDDADGEPCAICGKTILEHTKQMLHCPGQHRYCFTTSGEAEPQQTSAAVSHCLCSVCRTQRKSAVINLSKEEQFDFDQWHRKPMIGWSYRYLSYMTRALAAEAQLAALKTALEQCRNALKLAERFTDRTIARDPVRNALANAEKILEGE